MSQAEHRNIASRYATALFGIAGDDKSFSKIDAELKILAEYAEESSDFSDLLANPTLDAGQRVQLVGALVKTLKLSNTLGRFLKLLSQNGRLECLPLIAEIFSEKLRRENGELLAVVETAQPLLKKNETALQAMLKKHFGKPVMLEVQQNELLLGGLRVQVDGQLIDASVFGRFSRLKSHLQNGVEQIV